MLFFWPEFSGFSRKCQKSRSLPSPWLIFLLGEEIKWVARFWKLFSPPTVYFLGGKSIVWCWDRKIVPCLKSCSSWIYCWAVWKVPLSIFCQTERFQSPPPPQKKLFQTSKSHWGGKSRVVSSSKFEVKYCTIVPYMLFCFAKRPEKKLFLVPCL